MVKSIFKLIKDTEDVILQILQQESLLKTKCCLHAAIFFCRVSLFHKFQLLFLSRSFKHVYLPSALWGNVIREHPSYVCNLCSLLIPGPATYGSCHQIKLPKADNSEMSID